MKWVDGKDYGVPAADMDRLARCFNDLTGLAADVDDAGALGRARVQAVKRLVTLLEKHPHALGKLLGREFITATAFRKRLGVERRLEEQGFDVPAAFSLSGELPWLDQPA